LNGNFDKFNFFSVMFCSFKGNVYAYVIVSIIIICLIMKFIAATVDEFVAAGITYIKDACKMSDAFGAVTLIALANGAGDVITALVAGSSAGGVSYNIGSLYGAGFFVCSMVISLTILSMEPGHPLVVGAGTIYRDVFFYIFSTVVTIIFGAIGKIYWWSAVIFLVIYVLMVLVVVV